MPIHRWAVRHLYMPAIERRFSRLSASFLVFLLSAFLHEYLVYARSCPQHLNSDRIVSGLSSYALSRLSSLLCSALLCFALLCSASLWSALIVYYSCFFFCLYYLLFCLSYLFIISSSLLLFDTACSIFIFVSSLIFFCASLIFSSAMLCFCALLFF